LKVVSVLSKTQPSMSLPALRKTHGQVSCHHIFFIMCFATVSAVS